MMRCLTCGGNGECQGCSLSFRRKQTEQQLRWAHEATLAAVTERDALREQLQEARKIVERLVAYNAGAPWPDPRDAQRFLGDSEVSEEKP